ncbi:MAG: MerR family transcriptional regulator [Bacillota bacterium]
MKKEYQSIAAISNETGIAKEVLRKWEERYGFPQPERDSAGVRLYPAEQASRLKLIKRLLDDGMRPGQVVPLDDAALEMLLAQRKKQGFPARSSDIELNIVAWVQSRDPELLRDNLQTMLAQLGLRGFVVDAMPAMNEAVGNAWADGSISVKDEHLYTEVVQNLVRSALAAARPTAGAPRILLTTLTGELHTLGILMAETVMVLEGAACVSLGAQTPLPEIVAAAQAYRTDIVALSFSAAFPKKKIPPLLRELRSLCAAETRLWAGGSGVAGLDTTPRGVSLLPTLESGVDALEKYRQRRHA